MQQDWSDLKARLLVVALGIAVVAACGSGGNADDGTGDDGAGDDGADDAADDTGDDAPADGRWRDPTPYCYSSCSAPADCAAGPAGGISDADNYACVDGVCGWTGCNSTAECTVSYDSPNYTCEVAFGSIYPTCWETCDTVADCTIPGSALYDADNYACDDGKCRWTGCTSSAECSATVPSAPVCAVSEHSTTPTCFAACDTAADCGSAVPPFDADNYTCEDGACIYQGCNSTAECVELNPDTVCAATP